MFCLHSHKTTSEKLVGYGCPARWYATHFIAARLQDNYSFAAKAKILKAKILEDPGVARASDWITNRYAKNHLDSGVMARFLVPFLCPYGAGLSCNAHILSQFGSVTNSAVQIESRCT
jgi:hypothetical protein